MEKNIYYFLNEVNTETEQYEEECLTEMDQKRLTRSVLKKAGKGRKKILPVAGVCAAACLTVLAVGPFRGNVVDAMESFTYHIGAFLGIDEDLSPYEEVIQQSVTDKGVTVTLNSVVLDGDSLVVSVTEVYEEEIAENNPGMWANIYMNGKNISNSASGGAKPIDRHTVESVITYSLEQVDVSRQLDFKIKFEGSEAYSGGDWEFAFTASGKELAADTISIPMDYTFTLPNDAVITMTEFTSNAMGEKIYYTASKEGSAYDLKLEGTDNLGNPVSFYLKEASKEGGKFTIDNLDCNLDPEASSLTLTPYAVKMPEKSGRLSNDFKKAGDEFTINLK